MLASYWPTQSVNTSSRWQRKVKPLKRRNRPSIIQSTRRRDFLTPRSFIRLTALETAPPTSRNLLLRGGRRRSLATRLAIPRSDGFFFLFRFSADFSIFAFIQLEHRVTFSDSEKKKRHFRSPSRTRAHTPGVTEVTHWRRRLCARAHALPPKHRRCRFCPPSAHFSTGP